MLDLDLSIPSVATHPKGTPEVIVLAGVVYYLLRDDDTGQILRDDDTNEILYGEAA